MPDEVDDTKERERVAAELRRIRDEVRDRALQQPSTPARLPDGRTPPEPTRLVAEPEPSAPEPPARPDNAPLNEMWRVTPERHGWPLRPLWRVLRRFTAPQQAFNARQVQFDNEVLLYLDARLDAISRHYDKVLGIHRRHMAEIDERHLIVQEELVAHVHDLVKRIDLVLAGAERGRLSLEFALRDVRARLAALEERLGRT